MARKSEADLMPGYITRCYCSEWMSGGQKRGQKGAGDGVGRNGPRGEFLVVPDLYTQARKTEKNTLRKI